MTTQQQNELIADKAGIKVFENGMNGASHYGYYQRGQLLYYPELGSSDMPPIYHPDQDMNQLLEAIEVLRLIIRSGTYDYNDLFWVNITDSSDRGIVGTGKKLDLKTALHQAVVNYCKKL